MSVDGERRLLKKEWGKIPTRRSCYVSNELDDSENDGFYAAGICPFLLIHDPNTGESELSMLLVQELRHGSIRLNFLGGKRERGELPNETAYREFLEETGGLLDEDKGMLKRLIRNKKNQRLWLCEGRYILISLSSPQEWLHLPSRFDMKKQQWGHSIAENLIDGLEVKVLEEEMIKNKRELSPEQLKTKGLVWIPVRELSGSSVKPQLSEFLLSIFQLPEFEEFVNSISINPEVFEIAKHFEAQKWTSSTPFKRIRENSLYYQSPNRRRLNDSRGYLSRSDNRRHFLDPRAKPFYPSWGPSCKY